MNPGTGTYTLHIVYEHHIDWRMSFTGTVKCVFALDTPTPVRTATPTPALLVPTATPTNIALFDPTTTLPATPAPMATPGSALGPTATAPPEESVGCDIRVNTTLVGRVETPEGSRMDVEMAFRDAAGIPAGGISATVEIDKSGVISHAGATTNSSGVIDFLVLDGLPGPHSLELVDLRNQTGIRCRVLSGSSSFVMWTVDQEAPGNLLVGCDLLNGSSYISISGSGFDPNQVLIGQIQGPSRFNNFPIEVTANSGGSFELVLEAAEPGSYEVTLGMEMFTVVCI